MTALIIIGVIVLGLVAWFFSAYNGLIKLRNLTQEAWAQKIGRASCRERV